MTKAISLLAAMARRRLCHFKQAIFSVWSQKQQNKTLGSHYAHWLQAVLKTVKTQVTFETKKNYKGVYRVDSFVKPHTSWPHMSIGLCEHY